MENVSRNLDHFITAVTKENILKEGFFSKGLYLLLCVIYLAMSQFKVFLMMHKLKEHSKQQHTDMFYFLAYISSLSLNMSIAHASHTNPPSAWMENVNLTDGWTKVTLNPSNICCWVRGDTVTFTTKIHLETILKLTICQLCMPESLWLENIHISNNCECLNHDHQHTNGPLNKTTLFEQTHRLSIHSDKLTDAGASDMDRNYCQ